MAKSAADQQQVIVAWDHAELDGEAREFRVGSSALIEFIREHNEADILRELVQNEYDAHGKRLIVAFGQDALRITGTGRKIDSAGWKRLKVVFGTGAVIGDDEEIPPKANSIGSKNFGLRTLFLLGDRIYIRSGGWQTMLSLDGVPAHPIRDAETKGRPGVQIEVPYRTRPVGKLLAFDTAREAAALGAFTSELAPMLMKLAQPGGRSLESLIVSSARHARELQWRQTATALRSSSRGISLLQRKIVIHERPKRTALHELEFQLNVAVPDHLDAPDFPSYYKVRGHNVKLGCSVQLRQGRVNTKAKGIFYYPLGASKCFTGNAVSVSAPFEMNTARTALIDPVQSSWNAWLLEQAAAMTCQLLSGEWLQRFGATAYLAIVQRDDATVEGYADRICATLKEEAVWPTRARNGRAIVLAQANTIVLPSSPSLDGILSAQRYLDDRLHAEPKVRDLAKEAGALAFTLNAAIRLRCAGKDKRQLQTHLQPQEADFYYTEFPTSLEASKVQVQFARAFDEHKLSADNRADLRSAPTTLAADATLQAPNLPLWIVPQEMADLCDIPKTSQLHPELATSTTLRLICRTFSIADWVRTTAENLTSADEQTRTVLFHYILKHWRQFGRRIAMLRTLPVLRDHRGRWQKPCDLTLREAPYASVLADVLHFPHKDFAKDKDLARAFLFKTKIDGDNLVAFAQLIQEDPALAPSCEELLDNLSALLVPEVTGKLSQLRFLTGSDGALHRPRDIYQRTRVIEDTLGADAVFPAGTRLRLYERLGCPDRPKALDILGHLSRLREQNASPEQPDTLYSALNDALARERLAPAAYRASAIIWNGASYSTPADTLLGPRHRRVFLHAVPQVIAQSTRLDAALRALGVSSTPHERHWNTLFKWFNTKYLTLPGPITKAEIQALRGAYSKLDHIPDEIKQEDRWLLDDQGYLHTLRDVRQATYVIDDDPLLRAALKTASVAIGFADTAVPETRRFYAALGLRPLSALRREGTLTLGPEQRRATGVDPSILSWVHSFEFAYALAQILATRAARLQERIISPTRIRERLKQVRHVRCHQSINLTCTVAGHHVIVEKKVAIENTAIVLSGAPTPKEFQHLVGFAIAEWIWDGRPPEEVVTHIIFLLDLRDEGALSAHFQLLGIQYDPSVARKRARYETEADAVAPIKASIIAELSQTLGNRRLHEPSAKNSHPKPQRPSRAPLPALETVTMEECTATGRLKPKRTGSTIRLRSSSRAPTVPDEQADRALGRHAEELIYRHEIERIAALGYDAARVVWHAEADPDNASDHDIGSVDNEGQPIWIEVKATTGADGNFRWTRQEFERAVQARDRYWLYRVYNARSKTPKIKKFKDPIGMLSRGQLQIDVSGFYAEVEALL